MMKLINQQPQRSLYLWLYSIQSFSKFLMNAFTFYDNYVNTKHITFIIIDDSFKMNYSPQIGYLVSLFWSQFMLIIVKKYKQQITFLLFFTQIEKSTKNIEKNFLELEEIILKSIVKINISQPGRSHLISLWIDIILFQYQIERNFY
ncbi:hypothetical protein pb186bvf_008328 [Paramecium bursaria]